ncbi:MAG TPA: BTAD domain-containing putative transcriptional regulator [Gemmatimonadales bacterium]
MIRFRAFGPPAVHEGDRVLSGAAGQARRLALLALLARAGARGITRDKLLLYLWPDSPEDRARRSLTQAVYALRRDLGSDEAILGARDLRLNPAFITSDVEAFERAVAEGRHAEAVALYTGPFLDGFHPGDLPEFEEWSAAERQALARDYATALEGLAAEAMRRGDARAAVAAWRERARLDPHDARIAVAMMEAHARAGDRNAALQHARDHERRVRDDLGVAPDPAVPVFARRLKDGWTPEHSVVAVPEVPIPAQGPVAHPFAKDRPAAPPPVDAPHNRRWLLPAVVVLAALAVTWFAASRRDRKPHTIPLMAVGRVSDFTGDSVSGAAALADLVATNLARSPALRVVSTARLYELEHQVAGVAGSADVGVVMTAARRAGAVQLLDGALHRIGPGRLRLDLRQLDLTDGSVLHSFTTEGKDLFALADSGTRILLSRFGLPSPGAIGEVTARSEAAVRLYEEGLRAYVAGDRTPAERLFLAALEADTTFAMAAYYAARTSQAGFRETLHRWERASRLADRAPDRERLAIQGRAVGTPAARARALADTLASRYPDDVDGQLLLGQVLLTDGEFAIAARHLRRAVAMDSASLRASRGRCIACEAYGVLIQTQIAADSLPAAEAAARDWLRRRPRAVEPTALLAQVLVSQGRLAEARELAMVEADILPPARIDPVLSLGQRLTGDFGPVEAAAAARLGAGDPTGAYQLAQVRRDQGRFREATKLAEQYRVMIGAPLPMGGLLRARILFDAGRLGEAIALQDSMVARLATIDQPESVLHWRRAEVMVGLADALAARGDTVRLARLADSVMVDGAFGYGMHQKYHWHVRGLLAAATGRDADAIGYFRRAVHSLTSGYPRTNLALARALLRVGRPHEAVPILQATLRGGNTIATSLTELHALLGDAWSAAGGTDSAGTHQRWAERAWASAERVAGGPLQPWLGGR